jgi:hypothetical protein
MEILDLVFREKEMCKSRWLHGGAIVERFTICMVRAIVGSGEGGGVWHKATNPKPIKPHFFFIGFMWDTSLNFAFKGLKCVVHDIHGIVQSFL